MHLLSTLWIDECMEAMFPGCQEARERREARETSVPAPQPLAPVPSSDDGDCCVRGHAYPAEHCGGIGRVMSATVAASGLQVAASVRRRDAAWARGAGVTRLGASGDHDAEPCPADTATLLASWSISASLSSSG